MRSTDAERRKRAAARQARYRERQARHTEGDHSLCIAGRCDALPTPVDLDEVGDGDGGEAVTGDVTPAPKNSASHREPPADLRDRGRRLWAEMAGLRLGPAHVLLLERVCRLADRLERLDAELEGGEWLRPVIGELTESGAVEVQVIVGRPLGETRQHDVALKLLVAELRHAGRPAAAAPPAADSGIGGGGEGGGKRRGLAAIRGGLDTTG